ncbi:MAG: small subunit ribosomal protein [Rikenellaceae bacterium]|nr:small subunit ribosomal protein [Rikenellaceae bacterium]
MTTDPIADYLTRIRNAISAKHRIVEMPASNFLISLTQILKDEGYILNFKVDEESFPRKLIIALKYHPTMKISPIQKLERISKPGRRIYKKADELPKVMNGLGIAIISTSEGLMTDREARNRHIGGEVICYVS